MTTCTRSRSILMAAAFALASTSPSRAVDLPRYLFGNAHPVEGINSPATIDWSHAVRADGLEMFLARRPVDTTVIENDLYVSHRGSPNESWSEPAGVAELASERGDSQPSLSADGLTIYYLNGSDDERIYEIKTATRPTLTSPFGAPQTLFGGQPGGPAGTVAPSISADGLTLYLQYHETLSDAANIYLTHRAATDQPWGDLMPVPELNDPAKWQSRPSISADGRSLFFYEDNGHEMSNRASRGNGDLLVLVRATESSPWSQPINLSDSINSSNFEDFPLLSPDGATFYFGRQPGAAGDNENAKEIWEAPVLPFAQVSLSGSGDAYSQSFDTLGVDSATAGTDLPSGWTFTANDVVFNQSTTGSFPTSTRNFAGAYNAGGAGDADRTVATDYATDEGGELDFRAAVGDGALHALRLGFDIEAWQLRSGLGTNAGEASFHVVLEANSGDGFAQVADLGIVSTGKSLTRPASGTEVNGNDDAYRVAFDSGTIDVNVPAGATLRTRWISGDASRNVVFGLDNVSLRFAGMGDANVDGYFDSTDLVQVFQVGEYEDSTVGNSKWSEGDWNGDQDFTSGDLVDAFQRGTYESAQAASLAAVPEPATSAMLLVGLATLSAIRGRR